MASFIQQLLNGLQWGSFYALIALGYSMVYSILMLFNFAHGDVFMAGAYIGLFVALGVLGLVGTGTVSLPPPAAFLVILLATMALTSLVGLAVERVAYRPLREAPRASAAITGLMVGIFLETSNLAVLGASRRTFPALLPFSTYAVGPVSVTSLNIMIIVLALSLMLAVHLLVKGTKVGMAMRAMSVDYAIVPLMGVPLDRVIMFTFALGSALAGAAGVLFSMAYPVLEPYMGLLIGWKAFVAAILGGRGSVTGAVLGGFLLGFIEIFVAAVFVSTMRDFIAYGIVLVILSFKPYGLFGEEYTVRLRI